MHDYLFSIEVVRFAFVAGIVLSESDHAHQALSDIIPLRDIFGLLFFVSVGMLLEPGFVRENLTLVLLLVAVVSLTKGLICAGVGRAAPPRLPAGAPRRRTV